MTKQAPTSQPPPGADVTSSTGGPHQPMALSQEEVDGLVAGTIDSARFADRAGNAVDVATNPAAAAEASAAIPGAKAAPKEEPPG